MQPALQLNATTRRLAGCIKPIEKINPTEINQMYQILAGHYNSVSFSQFKQDLAEKTWSILLREATTGQIRGFSTLMQLEITVDHQSVVAFFSGDTIIHRDYWGETELPRLWAKHVFSVAETIHQARVYWFLISSGYKTYRFLPVFFREFYPTYRRNTPPAIKKTIDALGRLKFPTEYDPERGIICLKQAAPLRPGVAEITERRLKDPHVAFFARANPGHIHGDELACLTEITPTNLTRAGQRMLDRT